MIETDNLGHRLPELVRFGTSTWTYPGWKGLVYSRDYPATGAAAAMLAEYARHPLFRTVGIDSFFYRPPSQRTLLDYAASLPSGFRCVSKVWERITARTFTSPRSGPQNGELNPDWLNAPMFIAEVLEPMQLHFGQHLGPLVFEFQAIGRGEGFAVEQFIDALDRFLGSLPTSAQYAVELRNAEFLTPAYFAVLRDHGVAHVFNSWTRMPPIGEQLLLHESLTADFVVARALLRPGRTFANAVDAFAPYDRIREENPALRQELAALARTAINLRIPAYVIINNRAEGCAPLTIAAIARLLLDESPTPTLAAS
ncbi:MAG: DUF72 domain-containing protein [Gemmatimonadales bacterium]